MAEQQDEEFNFNPPSLADKLANGPGDGGNGTSGGLSPAAKNFQKDEDTPIYEWLKQFSGSSVRVTLERRSPEEWDGHQTGGVLDHFDELIDEELVKQRYGGGKYQVKVQKQLPNGRWNYAGARTFKIAGDPKLTGELFRGGRKEEDIPFAPAPDGDVVKSAMNLTAQLAREAQERADRAELRANNQQPNPMMSETFLSLVTEPLKMQIQTLTAQLNEKERVISEKDRIIHDLSNKKPDTFFQDTIAGKLLDGESARIEAIRTQFDSERRQLVQSYAEDNKRGQDRHDYEIKRVEDSHRRELQGLKDSLDARIESLKSGYESRLEAKDNRIKDLERDLNKTHAELGELRARKDKSVPEQLAEFAALREHMTAAGFIPGEQEEEDSAIDKIIEVAGPIVRGIGARLENAPQAQPQQMVKRRVVRAVPRKPEGQGEGRPALPAPGGVDLKPEDLAMAVAYIEQGVTNGIQPELFAQSVRNMVPPSILNVFKDKGVDYFLDEVAVKHVSLQSPLTTQIGRTFVRKVVKYLLTESTDLEAPVPTPTPAA